MIIKIDVVIKHYNRYCGAAPIKTSQYIKRNKRLGLINEACNDYLPEGEYTYYWYVGGKSILT
jgi:hypothetical protein